jgi:hypothetical protein
MVAEIGLIIVGFNFYMLEDKEQKSIDKDSAFISNKEKKILPRMDGKFDFK